MTGSLMIGNYFNWPISFFLITPQIFRQKRAYSEFLHLFSNFLTKVGFAVFQKNDVL